METKNIILSIILTLFVVSVQAQQIDSIPDLPADELEVIKNFELQAQSLNPIFQAPKISEIEKTDHNFDYDFDIPEVTFEPPKPLIKPLAYNKPLEKELYDGFADVSFGTPNSPKVGIGYNYHVEDWYEFGLLADYFSADDDEIELRDFDKTNVKLFGGYNFSPAIRLSVNADYEADNFNLFAHQALDELGAAYDRFTFRPSLTFNWFESIGSLIELTPYYVITDLNPLASTEDQLGAQLKINQKFGSKTLLNLNADYTQYSFDTTSTYDLLRVAPDFIINNSKMHITIGASINTFADDSLVILPNVAVDYHLNEFLDVSAGVSSQYELFDLNKQYNQNPFLAFGQNSYLAYSQMSPFLGAKLNKGKHQVNLIAQYNFDSNLPFWLDESDQTSSLNSIESLDYFSTSMQYGLTMKSTSINLTGNYSFFDSDFLRNWFINASVEQKLFDDRLSAMLQFLSNDSRFFREIPGEALYDLNFKLDFQINKRFSVYGQALNILDRQYDFVAFYPTYGATYRGGVFVKF